MLSTCQDVKSSAEQTPGNLRQRRQGKTEMMREEFKAAFQEQRKISQELVRILAQDEIEPSEFEFLIRMVLFNALEAKLQSFSEEKVLKWERRHAPRFSEWLKAQMGSLEATSR